MLFFLLRILLPITVQLLMVLPTFRVGFPGGSDSKGMATHSSILSWRIPLTEKPGRLQSLGWQRVRHDLMTSIVTVTTSSEKPSLTMPSQMFPVSIPSIMAFHILYGILPFTVFYSQKTVNSLQTGLVSYSSLNASCRAQGLNYCKHSSID